MADSRTRTAAPEGVVQDYLDFMLQEAVSTVPDEPAQQQVSVPEPEAPVVEEPAAPVSQAPPVQDETPTVQAPREPEPSMAEDGIPDWARSPFACLVFEVRGMSMAAAMTTLGGIVRIGEQLRPVAAQADWFMGLLRYNGRNIRVVDTARLLMPGQADSALAREQTQGCRGYGCVLILDGTDWGLAIDEAGESETLDAAQVRWRRRSGSRPWLAGTISRRLCALLDTPRITGMLQHSATQYEQVDASAPEG